MRGLTILCFAAWASLAALLPARADQVTVAVASNFLTVAEGLAAEFSKQTGHSVDLVHGSTGKLYAQIRAGAPFDVFLSADAARPARLVAEELAAVEDARSYAFGRLALVRLGTEPPVLDALADPARRVAIADPAVAPYGLAAQELLQGSRRANWRAGVVFGESVGQAFAFVATGNAELGLVALSQVQDFTGDLTHVVVPTSLHSPIRQDAVLLARAADNSAARAFFGYLFSTEAGVLIATAGYEVPR